MVITTALWILSTNARAQAPLSGTPLVIDFTGFSGAGFSPSPAAGQLDSDTWSTTGFDESVAFGATVTTGDAARGTNAGGVTTGGVYAFNVRAGNAALGTQPGGTDFTPGSFVLRLQNTAGRTLRAFDVSYTVYVLNNADRSNLLAFGHSPDNATWTDEASLDLISTAAGDAAGWVATPRAISLSGLDIPAGAFFYLRWYGDDAGGSGSRDELAIDDITVTVNEGCGNGAVDSGETCDDGGNNGGGDGFCLGDCSGIQDCGDGTKNGTEVCDQGAANGSGEGSCVLDCSGIQTCGDGTRNGTETCDDGDDNGSGDRMCLMGCDGIQTCGDGTVNGTEACDPPAEGAGCRADCLGVEVCGDGLIDASTGEQCDDGLACADGTPCACPLGFTSCNPAACASAGGGTCTTTSGDGCTSACLPEIGFTCDVGGPGCEPTCGTAHDFASDAEGWGVSDDGNVGVVFEHVPVVSPWGNTGFETTALVGGGGQADTSLRKWIAVPGAADATGVVLAVHYYLDAAPPSVGCVEISVDDGAVVPSFLSCVPTPAPSLEHDVYGFDVAELDLTAVGGMSVEVRVRFYDADVVGAYRGAVIDRIEVRADKDGDGVFELASDPACDCDDTLPLCAADCVTDADTDLLLACMDCDDGDAAVGAATTWYADADGDGFGDPAVEQLACGQPPGYLAGAGDCDDTSPACTTNCTTDGDGDGLAACRDCDDGDPGTGDPTRWYADTDGDGLGDSAAAQLACTAPAEHVATGGDCDDTNPHCGANCTDGDGDDWCSGVDCDDTNATCTGDCTDGDDDGTCAAVDCDDGAAGCAGDCATDGDNDGEPDCRDGCLDGDGDGYGTPGAVTSTCLGDDCDDTDGAVATARTYYGDGDRDGYGDAAVDVTQCTAPPNFVDNGDDCDDARASSNPAADEVVGDAFDDNCDGSVDCWDDLDGDGWGSSVVVASANGVDCTGTNRAEQSGDCNDDPLAGGAGANPAATDVIADGIDQNCSGGDACYEDEDGDGVGTPTKVDDLALDCTSSDRDFDEDDHDALRCADTDDDGCDDCSLGSFDPSDDGPDADGDGLCNNGDPDADDDGVPDDVDNCTLVANPNQADADEDLVGDACDDFTDGGNDGGGTPRTGDGCACNGSSSAPGLEWLLAGAVLLVTRRRR